MKLKQFKKLVDKYYKDCGDINVYMDCDGEFLPVKEVLKGGLVRWGGGIRLPVILIDYQYAGMDGISKERQEDKWK